MEKEKERKGGKSRIADSGERKGARKHGVQDRRQRMKVRTRKGGR